MSSQHKTFGYEKKNFTLFDIYSTNKYQLCSQKYIRNHATPVNEF